MVARLEIEIKAYIFFGVLQTRCVGQHLPRHASTTIHDFTLTEFDIYTRLQILRICKLSHI